MLVVHAHRITIFSIQSGDSEVSKNPVSEAQPAAGPQVAAFLISRATDRVIAGDFGRRFSDALEAVGVACVQHSGAVAAVINAHRQADCR